MRTITSKNANQLSNLLMGGAHKKPILGASPKCKIVIEIRQLAYNGP